MRHSKCNDLAGMGEGEGVLGSKDSCTCRRYIVNEDDRASADACRVRTHECVGEVSDAFHSFFRAGLWFRFARANECFWGILKRVAVVISYDLLRE